MLIYKKDFVKLTEEDKIVKECFHMYNGVLTHQIKQSLLKMLNHIAYECALDEEENECQD